MWSKTSHFGLLFSKQGEEFLIMDKRLPTRVVSVSMTVYFFISLSLYIIL